MEMEKTSEAMEVLEENEKYKKKWLLNLHIHYIWIIMTYNQQIC